MSESPFPQCKLDALEAVKRIMDEHFEGWILVYETELNDGVDIAATIYSGGRTRASGLLLFGQDDLKSRS